MRLLDTDIMVDIQRGYQPALTWIGSLAEAPGLPGHVVMELMEGCHNKEEITDLRRQVEAFRIHWPDDNDSNRALVTFSQARLVNRLSIPDALIAECAIGLDASLCTYNLKHFKAVPNLKTEQPYARTGPGGAPSPSSQG